MMIAAMKYRPPQYCAWCDARLTDGEQFVYELDVANFERGEVGFPEHPSLVRDDEVIPTCKKCRRSIVENSNALGDLEVRLRKETMLTILLIVSIVAIPILLKLFGV